MPTLTKDLSRALFYTAVFALTGCSMLANGYVGFHIGNGAFVGTVLAIIAVSADILKVFQPFKLHAALNTGSLFRAFLSSFLLVIFVSYSLYAGVTFGAGNRYTAVVQEQATKEKNQLVSGLYDEAKSKLDKETETRSPAELEAQRDAIITQGWNGGRTLGEVTNNCRNPSRRARSVCKQYLDLGVALAAAKRIEALKQRVANFEAQKLSALDDVRPADVQATLFSEWFGIPQQDVQWYVAITMAILMEASSLLAIYLYRSLLDPDKQAEFDKRHGGRDVSAGAGGGYDGGDAPLSPLGGGASSPGNVEIKVPLHNGHDKSQQPEVVLREFSNKD